MAAIAFILALSPNNTSQASPEIWRQFGWDKTDFSKTSVELGEIMMAVQVPLGHTSKDRIPAIDDPKFESADAISDLSAQSPVVSVELNGEARAYPLSVLTWHEIVNDTVGGVPVAITYCPLCNTALAFHRELDGRVFDFGTSGMLRNSDLVMYDRQTDSWWQQFTGEAIVGELTGSVLEGVPARLESFERFTARHPQGQVLVPRYPNQRRYGKNPYVGYDSASAPFLYSGDLPEDIEPMARVVMVATDQGPQAVALDFLRNEGEVKLGDVELTWEPGQNSALDAAVISEGRDVGNVVAQVKTDSGASDVVYHVTFAFAFHAFHPNGTIKVAR
ncbi:MAG: DUF3179 domain-containing protein [Rhizobiales bacterium]|nr:DUF3179 domain-containing protein [Hyphomicrobiales bacterium]